MHKQQHDSDGSRCHRHLCMAALLACHDTAKRLQVACISSTCQCDLAVPVSAGTIYYILSQQPR